MKLRQRILTGAVLGALLFNACSTKKDAFINRNWHALNTKYNVLYNGNLAFEEGRESLNNSYTDDYWEILPVERLEVTEEIKLDSEDNTPGFLRAEEKATKAIQKHSMDIRDHERNPQTDEAFLLLGKARYFDQRYIPALEAFNYILRKYDASDKLNEATIWREKTHIRLENEELALKNLKRLLKYEKLRDQEYADARAMMAQAYINLNSPDTAIQQLKIAAAYTGKNPEKGRYFYIIGQLYDRLGYTDSANLAFDRVVELNRKSPRIYMINAQLEKIQNTALNEETREPLLEHLTKLEENRENRPFLDKIFRQLAEYHMETGADSLGIVYYNRSLRATGNSPQLNALNYEDLANYHFDKDEYRLSGAYYDSVLPNLKENTKKFREISKKRDNLEDIITYEDLVKKADSVITLYKMSPEEQLAYFESYVKELKEKAEEEERKETARVTAGFAAFAESGGGQQNKGKFYFYNITSLGYGNNEFKNKWGDRELEDDWRWSNKTRLQSSSEPGSDTEAITSNSTNPTVGEERFSVEYYLERIPKEESYIDSLKAERNFANYQLGLIYKEKFNENQLAAQRLESVLSSEPAERLVLPAKYNLYKIYEMEGSPLAISMKEDIIKNHSDSRYAEILLNPNAVLAEATDSPEARYAQLFQSFEEQDFLTVITGAERNIQEFTGDPMVPKFEMLKANAIGRLQGFEPFKEALNYVALNYPNQAEGKKAQQMIAEQLPKLAPREFLQAEAVTGPANWKVVFPFKSQQKAGAEQLKERLEEAMKELNYRNSISLDLYDLETYFVVVHGFPSLDYAQGFVELLKINRDYRIDLQNFVILSSNYKIVQVHKNLHEYNNEVITPKP